MIFLKKNNSAKGFEKFGFNWEWKKN